MEHISPTQGPKVISSKVKMHMSVVDSVIRLSPCLGHPLSIALTQRPSLSAD